MTRPLSEFKFRGMTTGGNLAGYPIPLDKFLHGSLQVKGNRAFILYDDEANLGRAMSLSVSVDPKTVGQFTGYYDINGKEIYEDDIVDTPRHGRFDVIWCDHGFYLANERGDFHELGMLDGLKVVGTKHEAGESDA